MSKWLRKARPLTGDIRSAERYDQAWQTQPVPDWTSGQATLPDADLATQGPGMATPCNTEIVADAKGLTAFGGMSLFIAFTQKLGLAQALQRFVRFPKRQSTYSPTQLGECAVDAIACGITRIENTLLLSSDPLLPAARGLSRFPDHATMHRYITGFTAETVEQLHQASNALLRKAAHPRKPTGVTLDFDATDAVVYGQQEKAAFGHKNARDGHREYSIETCFLGGSRDVLHHELRAGNVSSNAAYPGFLREAMQHLPDGMKPALVRTDAGYFSQDNLAALDEMGVSFLVGCTPYNFLLDLAYLLDNWQRISPDEEVVSFDWAFKRDGVVRRVIVARHPDPKKTKPGNSGQLVLLPEATDDRGRYKHFACVTNIRNKSANVLWQTYAARSSMENAIKESKLGFGLEALPSSQFAANQAYVAFVFMTYNLMNWFKRFAFCGHVMMQRQMKAIRQWVVCVPAIIEQDAGCWRIHLPQGHPSLGLFRQIQQYLTKGAAIAT